MTIADLGSIDQALLIFGGPYSNLAATRAMRARAEVLDIPPARVVCTGDLVAYCAEPADTVDLIREWGIHVVMGNCEESLAASEPDCGCGFEPESSCSTLALTWYQYADQRVTAEQRRWMQGLPRHIDFSLSGRRFKTVHGSPSSINEFVFASSDVSLKQSRIGAADVDAIIGGHSGIPFGQRLDNGYWLNAGVIGMPANDGSSQVWYMLLDPVDGAVEISWHRLEYDHALSRQTTVAAGMREYAAALVDGHWPGLDILPAAELQQSGQPLNLPPLRMENEARLRRA